MEQLDKNRIPQHIAIIMDGNGRWAKEHGHERTYGHKAGVETVRRITAECVRLGVKYLTLYTFSTENWNRPADEISALMGLVLTSLEDEIFMKHNVRLRVIGDLDRLPKEVSEKLWHTMERTADNDTMTVVVALSYSSRWEITQAVRDIVWEIKKNNIMPTTIDPDEITEETVSKHTGGELRVSNYLLWQIAYSELYFTDTYWPDFDEQGLHEAIIDYQSRQRRFGKTGEQVEENK